MVALMAKQLIPLQQLSEDCCLPPGPVGNCNVHTDLPFLALSLGRLNNPLIFSSVVT